MGLEAQCACRWAGGAGMVKALLETREFILRGELKRTIAIADILAVAVAGDALRLQTADGDLILELGAARAQRWARKLTTPPPTLARKLGIGPNCKALVIGPINDEALREALREGEAAGPEEAGLSLAVVADAAALDKALAIHGAALGERPLWLVYAKGPRGNFGEGAVRRIMRAAGYIDTKVSAVSEGLSATRYSLRS